MAEGAGRVAPGTATGGQDLGGGALLYRLAILAAALAAVGSAALLALPSLAVDRRTPAEAKASARTAGRVRELTACVDELEALLRDGPGIREGDRHRRRVDAQVVLCREGRTRLGAMAAAARPAS